MMINKWPGAPLFGSVHPADAQNKTLISNNILVYDQGLESSDSLVIGGGGGGERGNTQGRKSVIFGC